MWYAPARLPAVTRDTFGPLVAYLVPGATALFGLAPYAAPVRAWLAAAPPDSPSVGGFLYLTLAALAAGMTVSAARWAVVDTLHAATGLKAPPLDFARLGRATAAFQLLIDIHYQHYLFYSNMLLATAAAYLGQRLYHGSVGVGWSDAAFAAAEAVFLLTSRDCLRKYYARAGQLLSPVGTGAGRARRRKGRVRRA